MNNIITKLGFALFILNTVEGYTIETLVGIPLYALFGVTSGCNVNEINLEIFWFVVLMLPGLLIHNIIPYYRNALKKESPNA